MQQKTWKVAPGLHLALKMHHYLFYNDATILTLNALYLHHLSRKTEGIGPMMSWQVNPLLIVPIPISEDPSGC